MEPLDLLNLTPLMVRKIGQAKVKIGLIDGPVAMDHPDLAGENIHQVPAKQATAFPWQTAWPVCMERSSPECFWRSGTGVRKCL